MALEADIMCGYKYNICKINKRDVYNPKGQHHV